MRKYWGFIFVLVFTSKLFAQGNSIYKELRLNEEGAKQLREVLARETKTIYEKKPGEESDKTNLYQIANLEIKEYIKKGDVLYADTLSRYLQQIADKLTAGRPSLKGLYKIYLYKSSIPNAFTYPDGTILVTTGLMACMTSQSQLAFVLGHELGHLIKKHSELAFEKENSLKKDFSFASPVNGGTMQILLHYSREYELEADAIGIELMSAASYDTREALKAIKSFAPYDTTYNYAKIDFKKYFNTEDFNVDSLLLKSQKNESVSYDWGSDDKLSTHPDIDKRYIAIKEMLANMNGVSINPVYEDSIKYLAIQYVAKMETILAAFSSESHIESLYLCLRTLNSNPDNKFLKLMISKNLLWLANYKSNNALNHTFRERNQRYGNHFKELESILKKLSPNDFKKLAYSYIKHSYVRSDKYEEMNFYMAYISEFYLGPGVSRFYYSQYLKDFPDGKYVGFADTKLQ